MKRFVTVTALLVVIVGVMLYFTPQSAQEEVINYSKYDAVINVYCRSTTVCGSVDTGLGRIVECKAETLPQTLAQCKGVDGISATFSGSMRDVDDIVDRLRAVKVDCLQLDGLYVACYVSARLQGGVTIDGQRVNMQIAYSNGTVTVGYPLILGDY